VDYCQICDSEELQPRVGNVESGDVMAVAVFFGAVRLIDNVELGGSS
jgi:pantothenate synthetase